MKAWEVRDGALGMYDAAPARPGIGEIVVRVSHTGLCGSDIPKLVSPGSFALPTPWRPGHEIVGIDPADRVVAVDPLVPCGTCARCTAGSTHLCAQLRRLGWDLPGGLAELVTAPAENVHPVPHQVSPPHAVLVDPAAVAIHGLRCNPVGSPGRLAIIGAGTVGLLTALHALDRGWDVTVVHRDGHPPSEAVVTAVAAAFRSPATLAGEQAFDLVVDAATGADPAPLDLALQLVTDGGAIVVQNAYHPGVGLPISVRDLFRRSIRLVGSYSHCRRHPGDFILALRLLRSHAAEITRLVAQPGTLEDLPTVLRGRTMRSVRQVLAVCTS